VEFAISPDRCSTGDKAPKTRLKTAVILLRKVYNFLTISLQFSLPWGELPRSKESVSCSSLSLFCLVHQLGRATRRSIPSPYGKDSTFSGAVRVKSEMITDYADFNVQICRRAGLKGSRNHCCSRYSKRNELRNVSASGKGSASLKTQLLTGTS
jgi:hypothetical protein